MKSVSRPLADIPVEVELVDEVKHCRTCRWFWGGIPPYGPFPAFDWTEEFPRSIRDGPPDPHRCHDVEQPSVEKPSPVRWTEVRQRGLEQIEPAVLRGCRKAPIMTIGINPNMTPFFAGRHGAGWAYPWFERPSTYAYYYRHARVHQESFDPERLQLVPGSEVRFEVDGFVSIERSDAHRWMDLAFFAGEKAPNGDVPEEKLRHVELTWLPTQRLAVFAGEEEAYGDDVPEEMLRHVERASLPAERPAMFAAARSRSTRRWVKVCRDEVVAARIDVRDGVEETLYANEVSYYTRLRGPLRRFGEYLAATGGHTDLSLVMGEDVSMHDMVGCASPGWGAKYDIPNGRVADNCVNERRFMLRQLLQSRPRMIFVVSTSSLRMFAEGVRRFGGRIDLAFENRDVFDLLEQTSRERCLVTLPRRPAGELTTRLVVTPHFSYADNFREQCRFNSGDWSFFRSRYPEAAEILSGCEMVNEREADFVSVYVSDARELDVIGVDRAAANVLMQHHYVPHELILRALKSEHEHAPLVTAPAPGEKPPVHLDRTEGDCSFCVNERWRFPEGCEYGKAEPPDEPGEG